MDEMTRLTLRVIELENKLKQLDSVVHGTSSVTTDQMMVSQEKLRIHIMEDVEKRRPEQPTLVDLIKNLIK